MVQRRTKVLAGKPTHNHDEFHLECLSTQDIRDDKLPSAEKIVCCGWRGRPSPSHSAADSQSFLFSVKTFRRFVPAAGRKKFFSPGPEPALGGP